MGVVDVPGHERFVRQMVAGATGIDVVLLVVAADDGVMPQTREHLAIIDLLGIDRGVVAITKTDLADADWIELVREDVRRLLEGTSLEGAPDRPGLARVRARACPSFSPRSTRSRPSAAARQRAGRCDCPSTACSPSPAPVPS